MSLKAGNRRIDIWSIEAMRLYRCCAQLELTKMDFNLFDAFVEDLLGEKNARPIIIVGASRIDDLLYRILEQASSYLKILNYLNRMNSWKETVQ